MLWLVIVGLGCAFWLHNLRSLCPSQPIAWDDYEKDYSDLPREVMAPHRLAEAQRAVERGEESAEASAKEVLQVGLTREADGRSGICCCIAAGLRCGEAALAIHSGCRECCKMWSFSHSGAQEMPMVCGKVLR